MIDFSKFNNLISLMTYFDTDDKCKQAIIESRWSEGDVWSAPIAVTIIALSAQIVALVANHAVGIFLAWEKQFA